VAQAPNGIAYPAGWEHWRVVAVSHRTDNKSLRAILGNDVAVRAARAGQVNPWPDGSVRAKVMWKDATHERWLEFRLKDAAKYASTAGWASRGGAAGISRPTGPARTSSRNALAATRP
jgi:hypothetical protein